MNANELIKSLNDKMLAKDSDVRFYWSATCGGEPDPKSYFVLWGYLKSHFQSEDVTKSVFIFKGMATMIENNTELLNNFEPYVIKSLKSDTKKEYVWDWIS